MTLVRRGARRRRVRIWVGVALAAGVVLALGPLVEMPPLGALIVRGCNRERSWRIYASRT
jgi:hypothetical protein